ncbi:hypothetical protein WS96_06555 [Burkholderia sp. MSMB1835]|nr:hypothetical protein WS96_06555 [Burkholderia sp. MSMB1835]
MWPPAILLQPLTQGRVSAVLEYLGDLRFVLPEPVFEFGLDGDHLDLVNSPATGHEIGGDMLFDGLFTWRALPFAVQHHERTLMAALVGAQKLVALGVDTRVITAFIYD